MCSFKASGLSYKPNKLLVSRVFNWSSNNIIEIVLMIEVFQNIIQLRLEGGEVGDLLTNI